MLIYIFYFFIAIVIIQLFYYLGIFGKFAFSKPQNIKQQNIPVSVIVCAKNEEENVKKYIPLLAEQNYPDFEIVLIDDASSDETLEVFEEFEKQYSNIRLVKVQNNEAFWGNKKYALTLGIKASKKDYLLFTDADCYPTSKEWITAMTSQFTEEKTIILGYGGYEKERSLLNKIIRFETVLTAVQYFSWAKAGLPYMGVGRNLAYKKEEFFNVNGFIEHIQVRSGDDDLFVNQAANKANTTIAYNPEGFTYSRPKQSYSEWFIQKRRHVTTANHYKFFDKIQLSLFYSSQLFFFLLVIVLLSFQFQWIAVLALLATRYTIAWIVMGFSAGKLRERDLKIWFPVVEMVLIFTQINIFITNIFSKPVHWK
ncbi:MULTISPECIES: glycosyltransferase [Flavobacterium]|jgi:glycosyltransferase involved in cell wall biosynthesis|uniref:Glycosyl transferase family 2 n=1 Tax=Flavobacterium pectinovorum TaxID=29533 RepID=A0AB36P6B5_9FLAO|nr:MULTISPECIES: glycosyltransferase [Flavobacterium]KIQ18817.1 glycosyl transferase family 2 [Flavobacterium sp. MEB061]OXB07714.1 glycosyl transferase family 2 [Flavobacterium pectinovorum]SHM77723.1 Glycosyltransferase, catalytic subunit of cellulose synthase and poly-beta-1,6-N-acetylglucosamine synthase [Flavobacterium pectinovorum]